MRTGKISYPIMKRSVWKQIHKNCAALSQDQGGAVVLSAAAGRISSPYAIRRSIYRAIGGLYEKGAVAEGISFNLLLPEEVEEQTLAEWVKQINEVCTEGKIHIMDVQARVEQSIKEANLVVNAGGRAAFFTPKRPEAGQDLLVVGHVGVEGTLVLESILHDKLRMRYAESFLEEIRQYPEQFDLRPAVEALVSYGVQSMHQIGEGGILAALWEMMDGAGVGMDITLKDILIRQQTVEVCEFAGVNPYQLASLGAMLVACDDGESVVKRLAGIGVAAAVIGSINQESARKIHHDDEIRYLDKPQQDELIRLAYF